MKSLIVLIATLWISFSHAAQLSVELRPREPVAGEVFQMNFTIETSAKSEPYISFDPGKAEVQGRRKVGTSVQTTIINGAVETKRITRYTYDLIVNDPGRLILRDIQAEVNSKVLKHERIETNVLREKKEPEKYFLQAEISNETLYLGEGATVNYYLYFRVPVLGTEIREFPKLNDFIKRFHMPPEQIETIERNGTLYRRKLIYSARVYPEQVGTLKVDPLEVRLQYSMEGNAGSPFSGFGFSSRKSQVRSTQSQALEVEVQPLPLAGMPKDFTGLVGEHEVSFSITKQNYLVNEPIELKLEVSGPGALENLSAPILLNSPSLENFDTESAFEELDKVSAKKTFEYTYLARESLNFDQDVKSFTYFDPLTQEYKSKEIIIPPIVVSGGGGVTTGLNQDSRMRDSLAREQRRERGAIGKKILAPSWEESGFLTARYSFITLLNILLATTLFGLLTVLLCMHLRERRSHLLYSKYLDEMKRNGITYRSLFSLFDSFRLDIGAEKRSFNELIEDLKLREDEEKYFKALLREAEKVSFKNSKDVLNLNFNKGFFERLVYKFQKVINENHKKH